MALIFLLLSFACAVSAQAVDFDNSFNLIRVDGWNCVPSFHHDDYLITTCSNFTDVPPLDIYRHDVFVWDCSSHPCVEVQTLYNTGIRFTTLHSYERISAERFTFASNRISIDYNDNIYQCVIDSGNFSCEIIFLVPLLDNTTYYDVTVNSISSDSNGNFRVIARGHVISRNTFNVIHFDCLNGSIVCILISEENTEELYGFGVDRILVFKAGEIAIMTDMYRDNSRGGLFKLNCNPVHVTNGENGPNCTVVSISTISGATPGINFGGWMAGKMIGDDIGLLVSAHRWGENREGAIGSFLCSEGLTGDPRAPCTTHEIDLHIAPSEGCYQDICDFGGGAISIDGSGYHFAVGVYLANYLRGEVIVYSCPDYPVILCARAGNFRPDKPPRSDMYGMRVSYNHNGTLLAVGAGHPKFFYDSKDPLSLWTVNTYFNESIPATTSSREKVLEKVRKIMVEKAKIPKWTPEQDAEYILQNKEEIIRMQKKFRN